MRHSLKGKVSHSMIYGNSKTYLIDQERCSGAHVCVVCDISAANTLLFGPIFVLQLASAGRRLES